MDVARNLPWGTPGAQRAIIRDQDQKRPILPAERYFVIFDFLFVILDVLEVTLCANVIYN